MSVSEDELRRTLARLDDVEVPPAPFEVVHRRARRSTRRRRAASVAAVVVVVASVAVGSRVLSGGGGEAPPSQVLPAPTDGIVSAWRRVGDVPLSHRDPGTMAEVAGRLLVFGGSPPHYCEGTSLCPSARPLGGGAVFDPSTRSWTPMSRPPRSAPVTGGGEWAVDGTRLVMLTNRFPTRVVTYDVTSDRWQVLPAPPVPLTGNDMLGAGGGFAYVADQDDRQGDRPGDREQGRVERLDLSTGRWTLLPASPFRPRLSVRAMSVTSHGLLVYGLYGLDPDDRHYQAEVEQYADGRWRRFASPGGLQAAGYSFAWTGSRLVAPYAGSTSGGALDPASGRWVRYDPQPDPDRAGWRLGLQARGSGDFVLAGGLLFDVAEGTSRVVRRPPGADQEAQGVIVGGFLYAVDARSVLWRVLLDTPGNPHLTAHPAP
jgi:hypothetical protein